MTRSQLENLLEVTFRGGGKVKSSRLFSRFRRLLGALRKVQPAESNTDTIWMCPRIHTQGKSSAWHETTVHLYGGKAYVTLDHRYSFSVDLEKKEFENLLISENLRSKDAGDELAEWWFTQLEKEIQAFVEDPEGYNQFVEKRLPLRYRLGKVQRKEVWDSGKVGHYLVRDDLTKAEKDAFQQVLQEFQYHPPLRKMARDTFLRFCRIAYDAVFLKDPPCSLVKRYRLHADGRDDGLLKLPPHDPEAFQKWMKESPRGGHPWEIVRGGTFTHISLYVHYEEREKEWKLTLEGSSVNRAAETVKIAAALNRAKVKFDLREKEYLAALIQGEDWIGVVPETVLPMDCEYLFEPYGEEIRSFIHLQDLGKSQKLKNKIIWFPPRRLTPAAPVPTP